MKRKLDDDKLREVILARITKGAAFMSGDYQTLMQTTRNHLADMSRAEIFEKYPQHTYDIKAS